MVQIPQTTYNLVPPVAFAGMLADSGPHDIESALAEEPFDCGLGVVQGTSMGIGNTPQVKLPDNTGEVATFKGVTQFLSFKEPIAGSTVRYQATDTVPVITMGRVWVHIDETVGATMVNEGPVYLVHSGAQAGKFRGDANSGAATLIPNAKCKIGGSAGGIAQIKVNLP